MTFDTTTVRRGRSDQPSDRYCLFNRDRRAAGNFDRRLEGERRQSQRRTECACFGRRSRSATRRTQPILDGNGAIVTAIPTVFPSIDIGTA